MFFYQRTTPGLSIYSYLIGEEEVREAVVIDPVRDVDDYIFVAQQQRMRITHILETHVHADFVSGAKELKARLGNIPLIHCSGMGGEEWIPSYADQVVQEGDEIVVGSLIFRAVHTPGHTPEHVMWVLEERGQEQILFTGDCLFVGAVGRPDLLGQESIRYLAGQLYHTVFEKLSPFSDAVKVMPAHGAGSLCGKALGTRPSSTLGQERRDNPFLLKISEEEWVKKLMEEMPPSPPYFSRMKKINVRGAPLWDKKQQEYLSFKEVQNELNKGSLLIDMRSKELFSEGHIQGAINIPLHPQLSTWAGWVLPDNVSLVFLLDSNTEESLVIESFLRVGFDKIRGFFKGGMEEWAREGLPIARLPFLSPEELFNQLKEQEAPYVLDVRTETEWKAGHITGAYWFPLGQVPWESLELPAGRPIAVVCGSGYRASIAASFLQRGKFQAVSNVQGGMAAWKSKGLPLEK